MGIDTMEWEYILWNGNRYYGMGIDTMELE